MKSIIIYFSNVPDFHRVLLLFGSLFSFWILEKFYGTTYKYRKWKHAYRNSLFALLAFPIQFILGIALVSLTTWIHTYHFGLFYILKFDVHPFLMLISTFVFLDFFEYVYHVVMHKVKRLWMFHLVHHSDRVLDVTSTLREHPIETTIRLTFLLVWVFILGCSFWAILLRQFIQIIANVFVHANIKLPHRLDVILGWVFITPSLHQTHHHFQRPLTDKNFGDVLSFWDRIFGTYQRTNAESNIFGVDTYFSPTENTCFKTLVFMPFKKYRTPKEIDPLVLLSKDLE